MDPDEIERLRQADVQRYLDAQGQPSSPVDPVHEQLKLQTNVQAHILLLMSISAILAAVPGLIWLLVMAFFVFLFLVGG